MKIQSYTSRWDFMLRRCQGKRVLHLGCIGMTEEPLVVKVAAMCDGRAFHARLREVALQSDGIDYDSAAVGELQRLGFREIVYGDLHRLDELGLQGPFDVILAGDLIQHLHNPGLVLQQVLPLVSETSSLVLSTPNSFGLPHFIRYARGQAVDGNDHVLSFNIFTLRNLLRKHGFEITEAHSCYDRPPCGWRDRLRVALGTPLLKLFPDFGGTLLIVAGRIATNSQSVGSVPAQ